MGLLFTTEGTRRIINTLNTAFDGPSPQGGPAIGLALIQSYALVSGSNLNNLLNDTTGALYKPGALAMMLDLLPYDQGSGNGNDGNGPPTTTPTVGAGPSNSPNPLFKKAAKRWYHFLTKVLGQTPTTVNGVTTYGAAFTALQSALSTAILKTATNSSGGTLNIVRISFDHVEIDENTATTPGNAPPSVVVYDVPLPVDSGTPNTAPYLRHITLFTVRVPQGEKGTQYTTNPAFSAPWNTDANQ